MSGLCQYKDIFGKPGEGIHASRIAGLALNDIIPTILLILGISYLANTPLYLTTIFVVITTIFIHKMFCVDTALNVALGI